MKAEKREGRRPPLLKRSIGARILLAVFLILTTVMILIQAGIRLMVSNYNNNYYSDIGNLISMLASQDMIFYMDDNNKEWDADTKEMFSRLCREYDLYSIWVESISPPYEVGVNKLYIAGVKENEYEEEWDIGKEYPLSDEEKMIFSGAKESAVRSYRSSHGRRLIAYLHGIYDDDGKCVAIIGVNFDRDRITRMVENDIIFLSLMIGVIFVGLMFILGMVFHRSIFKPLFVISERMRDYASGGNLSTEKLQINGEDELSRVAASYNKMTDEISEYVEKVGVLEKEKLMSEAEMNAAAQIQAGMLPPPSFEAPQIRIEAVMRPAKEVAGDFYDYLTLPDGRMFFCIADVSGKGISAAIYMAEAINAIRYNAALYSSPAGIMRAANDDLCARNPEKLFVTAFAAMYDPSNGNLVYCSAGHDTPYIMEPGKITPLNEANCLLLGLFSDEEYTEASVQVRPGGTLFLYTDGLTEAMNPDRKQYGRQRMEAELKSYAKEGTEESLTAKMEASAAAFVSGAEVHDDLTMLAVHFGRTAVFKAVTDENGALRKMLLEEEGLSMREKKKICLAAEEIFVNICSYAYDNNESETVRVSTLLTEDSYTLVFTDNGTPYDPLESIVSVEDYDPDEQIGGLGKLMAASITDRQEYEYRDEMNVLTLIKHLK